MLAWDVTRGQFIDAVQTIGILAIAGALIYVIRRLEQNVKAAADILRDVRRMSESLTRRVDRLERMLEPPPGDERRGL